MSRPPLTSQQARAAHLAEGDACVMAGAGSGKTTVLTERFATLVLRGSAGPREIAALTFTEKAADEMRERIAEAFAEPGPAALRERARDVEFAPISTIHAFCARLLREHAIDAGVDPAFSLLDGTAATLLLEDAYDAVARRLRAAGDPRTAVLGLLGDEHAGKSVQALLEKVRGDGSGPRSLSWARGPVSLEDALGSLSAALCGLSEAAAAARLPPEQAAALAADLARLPSPEALSDATFDAARIAAEFGDGDTIGGLVRVSRASGVRPVRDARDAACEAYARVTGALLDEVGVRQVIDPLRDLVVEVEREYGQRKRERGSLDFADLEREALGLLGRLAARGRAPEGAPRELLVDEFQDTNPVQVAILDRLRRPPGAPAVPQFAVGDAKQSIYRFRRADVRGILRAFAQAGPAGRTSLTESFRSRPELVAFHNALFRRLFADGAAGVPPEDLTACAAFSGATRLGKEGPASLPAEVLVVDGGPAFQGDAWSRRVAEARAIAARIRSWTDGTEAVTKVRRGPDGLDLPPRPIGFGDVAVLLRARTDVKVYERALLEAGIPFHVGRGRGFFETEEIADLLHLLRVVHDPEDRFALAAWMTSPAVGATDAQLLAAFTAKEGPFAALEGDPAFQGPLAALARLRRLAAGSALEAVVGEAVALFGGIPAALLQDGGERRARNLEKAVAIARRLDAEGDHGLSDYLRRLTGLREREADEAEAAAGPGEEDSVALLTVHGAKGLEWPCVVLADAGRKPGGGRVSAFRAAEGGACAWRLRDPFEGVALSSGGYLALEESERALEAEESLRLLYVALTRAEERLLLTMSASGTNQKAAGGKPAKPKDVHGWGAAIWSLLGLPLVPGRVETTLDGAPLVVTVEPPAGPPADSGPAAPWIRRHGPEGILRGAADDGGPKVRAEARRLWQRARRAPATLGRTPFVVTVSDLLAFAASPQAYYRDRLLGPEAESLPSRGADLSGACLEPDDPASRDSEEDDDAARAAAREDRLDEGHEEIDGLDRAALGRAVHLAIERLGPGRAGLLDLVLGAVGEEFGEDALPLATKAALAMVERFVASATGREMEAALARGEAVGREVAFHARIAFPEKERVGPFESLLVKGTVDLWLPGTGGGVRILDHKTNSPRGPHRDAAALVAHYAPQLRLYALAAERMPGSPRVEGAALLLLDPEWGGMGVAVEAPVGVSGEALLETRRLCRAMALGLHEGRFPARWQDLT